MADELSEELKGQLAKLADQYFKHKRGAIVVQPKQVQVSGKPFQRHKFWQKVTEDTAFMVENGRWAWKKKISLDIIDLCSIHFNEVFWEKAQELKRETSDRVKSSDEVTISTPHGDKFGLGVYRAAHDIETNEKCVIYLPTGRKSKIHIGWYESKFKGDNFMPDPVTIKELYDPYDLDPNKIIVYDESGNTALRLNAYVPPDWRLEPVDPDAELPLEVLTLMGHLFPDPKALKYVWDWIHTAVFSRCETYLVLNSSKGIGKGVLAKMIEALVGEVHYGEAQRSFLDSQFNGLLKNKRLVYLDELEIKDKARVDKLKSYINQQQNIEEKHKEANKTIKIYASFLITNNAEGDMYIEDDDRRFSVVDATTDKLEDVMSNKEVQEFINKKLTDPEYILKLGSWLTNRGVGEDHDAFSIFRGKKFEVLVEASMWGWQRFLVDLCRKGVDKDEKGRPMFKGWNHSELKKMYKRDEGADFPMKGKQGINDFLRNSRIKGERIAKVGSNTYDPWLMIPLLCDGDDSGGEIIEDELGDL